MPVHPKEKCTLPINDAIMMTVQERFYALMDYYGRPKGEFAKTIGTTINNLSVYYHRDRISQPLIERIKTCFPEVNPEWLETGEGAMLSGEAIVRPENPFLISDKKIERPNVYVPGLRVDSYIRVSGFSMPPMVKNGDIIGVISQEIGNVDPSHPYLFLMKDGSLMTKMITAVGEDTISVNNGSTAIKKPFTIPRGNVKGLMKVVFIGKIV